MTEGPMRDSLHRIPLTRSWRRSAGAGTPATREVLAVDAARRSTSMRCLARILAGALMITTLVAGCGGTGRVSVKLGFSDLDSGGEPELRARCDCSEDGWKELGRGGTTSFRIAGWFAQRTVFADGSCNIAVVYRNSGSSRESTNVAVRFPNPRQPQGEAVLQELRYQAIEEFESPRRGSHRDPTPPGKPTKD